MKNKSLPLFSVIVATAALALSTVAGRAEKKVEDLAKQFKPVLVATPAAELPAKATTLVVKSEPADKQNATIAVVRVVSEINPAASALVVGAISRAEPSVSGIAAKEASALQPKLNNEIALAAASSGANGQVGLAANPPFPNPGTDPGKGKKKGHYKGARPPSNN